MNSAAGRGLKGLARRPQVIGWRRRAADRIAEVAAAVHDSQDYVSVAHLPADRRPRYGHGRPPNPDLDRILRQHCDAYLETARTVASYSSDLATVPRAVQRDSSPYWIQAWLPPLDAAVLYSWIRSRRPERYVEVGSGISTRFAAQAVRDGKLPTKIVSIDPAPRTEVEAVCDESVRRPLEATDLGLFRDLGPTDVLFVDNSHMALVNSDVVAFFLDILPNLPPGLLVGIHDIFLPCDYPPEWSTWMFSEQYLLAAYLLGGGARIRPEMPSYLVSGDPDLSAPLAPLFDLPVLGGLERRGWSFWFTVTSDT